MADTAITPPVGSLTLSSSAPIRAYGLQLTGYAVTIGNATYPGTGSLTFSSAAPLNAGTVQPLVGSLALASSTATLGDPALGTAVASLSVTDAEFINSGDMRLIITGYAPQLVGGSSGITVEPGSGSLGLSEASPSRAYGLQLVGGQVTLAEALNPATDTLSLVGRGIQIDVASPLSPAPPRGQLNISSAAITNILVNNVADVPTGSVSITGRSATTKTDIAQGIVQLRLTGAAPTVSGGGLPKIGTPIENANATQYTGRDNICDRTGFRALPGELVKDAYGNMVLKRYRDSRHPQEFVRSTPERRHGPKRRESEPEFIDDLYPGGVTSDDL